MKKFGFAAVVASGLAAAALGFAGPAQASDEVTVPVTPMGYSSGVDHLDWLNDIQPKVNVPQVDTSVRSNP
jgi:ABC-type glycerol-3-phosphate transport system substrate-binding protein